MFNIKIKQISIYPFFFFVTLSFFALHLISFNVYANNNPLINIFSTNQTNDDPYDEFNLLSNIDDFVKVFSKCKNIITICGAGISVSCGIPDFRSATGLYNTLDCDKIGIPSAELLFDLEF